MTARKTALGLASLIALLAGCSHADPRASSPIDTFESQLSPNVHLIRRTVVYRVDGASVAAVRDRMKRHGRRAKSSMVSPIKLVT